MPVVYKYNLFIYLHNVKKKLLTYNVFTNQGFHILMDSLNGFGGLACKSLEYLKDEYSSKNIIAMPVMSNNYILDDENSELQIVNTSLLYSSLNEHSNMFVPLATSHGGWIKSQNKLNLDYLSYKV